jgi:hypothetical protein
MVSLTLKNSIVAGAVCSGTIIDGLGNLSSSSSCPGIVVADAKLGALQLNDPGTTATHALLAGSPAIDAAVGTAPPQTSAV